MFVKSGESEIFVVWLEFEEKLVCYNANLDKF